MSTPISALDLRPATRSVLSRNGITTVEQLRKQQLKLSSMPGVGVGIVNEAIGSLLLFDDNHTTPSDNQDHSPF